MAIYGRDFYGLSKYGPNLRTAFDVGPFQAVPDGYGSIRVSWTSPSGDWSGLRLLRSGSGYAVNENDGLVLVDSTSTETEFLDTALSGGSWYYYTLFVQDDQGLWNRAASTSSLAIKKPWVRLEHPFIDPLIDPRNYGTTPTGYADLLWERTPRYFRYLRRDQSAFTDDYVLDPQQAGITIYDTSNFDAENQHLRRFYDVLGWGLDLVHNYANTLLWANDPKRMHLADVDRLAQEMGISFEYGVPASVMRMKVQNAALLARRRGTLEGMRDAVNLSTGWDVDLEPNQNLFLNRDQSEFANPIYPQWAPGTNYATGQKVKYAGMIFAALKGAFGNAQHPPDAGGSNTWWTQITDADVNTLTNPDTGAQLTWRSFANLGIGYSPQPLSLASGISSPVDTVGTDSNAVAIRHNDTETTPPYEIVGAANPANNYNVQPDPGPAIRQGIPIPLPPQWDKTTEEYRPGQLVRRNGKTYRSLGYSQGQDESPTGQDYAPMDGSPYWEQVGIDERPLLAYSFYGHGPFTGTAGSGGVAITPGLMFFDEHGALLSDQTTVTTSSNVFFDTFNHEPWRYWTDRIPDFTWSGQKWTQSSGNWYVEVDGECIAYPGGVGVTTVTVPSTLTAYRIAVTFRNVAGTGRTDAMVLRYVDANNYLRVTRTKVQKRSAGTLTDLYTLTTPLKDGDRVQMKMDDTANTWALLVNGTQVATGSSVLSGAAAPYKHGMMVE